MAITVQLQTESPTTTVSPVTLSVTLGAGANRRLLVCVLVDSFSNIEAGIPTSVTYSGIPMELVTDGTNVAQAGVSALATGPSTGTTMTASWYVLREAQLPANGAHDVVATVPGTQGVVRIVVGAWVLEGCSQGANVRSVANATADASVSTAIGAILGQGELSDAILVCGCNDTNTGTIQITIGGVSLTEDFDVDQGGSSRAAAGTDLTAPSGGPVGVAMTYTVASTGRTAMSALRLAEPLVVTGGSVALTLET